MFSSLGYHVVCFDVLLGHLGGQLVDHFYKPEADKLPPHRKCLIK